MLRAQRIWDTRGPVPPGNCRNGTVEMGRGCGNVTSPFVELVDVTLFGVSWGEGQEPSQ